MDHTITISSIIYYVETNILEKMEFSNMEKSIGMTYRYIRQLFSEYTNTTLSNYINERKTANAAFEIVHTSRDMIDISLSYGFESYDTFTRVFKRHTGYTPVEFRKSRQSVTIGLIGIGMYAPIVRKEEYMKDKIIASKSESRCILFGVPKVEFSTGKCVPFAACLESALAYLSHPYIHDYATIMAASGAAFRILWNKNRWDAEAVDLRNLNENDSYEPFDYAFRAVGMDYAVIEKESTSKEDFIKVVKESVDQGVPVIGFGIVGPPEACLITGYDNEGDTLIGWSYFQENPEFLTGVTTLENGYFSTDVWWENPGSTHAFILKRSYEPKITLKDMLERIQKVMTMSGVGEYWAGQKAYDGWAQAIQNNEFFKSDSITPIILESVFCQGDGETVLGEGRYWGSIFFRNAAKENDSITILCEKIADLMEKISYSGQEMTKVRNGAIFHEQVIQTFCQDGIREKLAGLIVQARSYEAEATGYLNKILDTL